MSSEDGSRAETPGVEKALVAALGFEPTAGLSDDAANLLVDDGSGNALDWSSSGSDADLGDSDVEVQDVDAVADVAKASASPSHAKAPDSTMTPPKGKGKGPRTYKNKTSAGRTTKSPGKAKGAKPATSGSAKTSTSSRHSGQGNRKSASPKAGGAPKTVRVSPVEPDTGADPASLTDTDSTATNRSATSGPDTTNEVKPWATSDSLGAAGFDAVSLAHDETGPLPSGGVDVTGPISAAVDVQEPSLNIGEAVSPETIPAGVNELNTVPATETVLAEAHPGAPVADAAPMAPVVDPPPPAVGDPAPPAGPGINGQESAPGVVGRVGPGSGIKGDLAARVPQLLDQDFLKRTPRVRARKVRRVVRHIDPWSILTFSVLFFLCLFSALLLASVLVWNAAVAAGTIENMESFIREIGDYQTYEIKGDVVFRAAMVIAGILTLATSVMVVLLSVVFNLISDLVGGIRVTVVEEETVRVRRR